MHLTRLLRVLDNVGMSLSKTKAARFKRISLKKCSAQYLQAVSPFIIAFGKEAND